MQLEDVLIAKQDVLNVLQMVAQNVQADILKILVQVNYNVLLVLELQIVKLVH